MKMMILILTILAGFETQAQETVILQAGSHGLLLSNRLVGSKQEPKAESLRALINDCKEIDGFIADEGYMASMNWDYWHPSGKGAFNAEQIAAEVNRRFNEVGSMNVDEIAKPLDQGADLSALIRSVLGRDQADLDADLKVKLAAYEQRILDHIPENAIVVSGVASDSNGYSERFIGVYYAPERKIVVLGVSQID